MKYRICLVALFLVVCSVSWVFSQDDLMPLNSDELGPHQRPLVTFTHGQHAKVLYCNRCHHDYDAYLNNKIKGEEDVSGQKCAECHGKAPTDKNPVPLLEAMHANCKGCHEDMAAEGMKSGPVTCGDCHQK
jgi:predicted CXXCH cytochrome family protein